MPTSNNGYTLIELLVVLALMAGMAMPLTQLVQQREREREVKRALWEIRDALHSRPWRACASRACGSRPR